MTACIIPDADVPDGILRAYAADGRLICELQLAPVYMATTFLEPPEPDIASWRINPLAAERYVAMKTWFRYGHYTAGQA